MMERTFLYLYFAVAIALAILTVPNIFAKQGDEFEPAIVSVMSALR